VGRAVSSVVYSVPTWRRGIVADARTIWAGPWSGLADSARSGGIDGIARTDRRSGRGDFAQPAPAPTPVRSGRAHGVGRIDSRARRPPADYRGARREWLRAGGRRAPLGSRQAGRPGTDSG